MAKKFSKPELSRLINGDIEIPEAPIAEIKLRLDHALVKAYPQYNRSTLQKFIKNGQVKVNDQIIKKPNFLISETDELNLQIQPTEKLPNIPIIYEDQNVIIINKPCGILTVSKGDFNPEPTLEAYGHIVHRLDRATSGVIVIAKNLETRKYIQKQFQDRRAHKTYYAIVAGVPKLPQAVIDVPIARNLKRPTTFQPDLNGRSAITEYSIIKHSDHYSFLILKPRTGRTHQLRVHLKHLGTPILGDPIYSTNTHLPSGIANRLYLHASQLEITLPGGERRSFIAPLPDDFRTAISTLISPKALEDVLW